MLHVQLENDMIMWSCIDKDEYTRTQPSWAAAQ